MVNPPRPFTTVSYTPVEGYLTSEYTCVAAGTPVKTFNISREFSGHIAATTLSAKQQVVIARDEHLISTLPVALQQQIMAHECAHVLLGHITPENLKHMSYGNMDKNLYILSETNAECKSVELLVNIGWNEHTFKQLVTAWHNIPEMAGTVEERAAHLVTCPAFPKY
jgi:uncharacterized protein YejL (UPF0352 family)